MKKLTFTLFMLIAFCWCAIFYGCKKNDGDYSYVNAKQSFNGTAYDYLKSKPGVFDSMLFVVDRLKLTDTLKQSKVTVFAVNNQSFKLALDNFNTIRTQGGRPAISLKDYNFDLLDSLMCRYIFKGVYPSDSMTLSDGHNFFGLRYNYAMNAKKTISTAQGQVGAGSSLITLSDMRNRTFKSVWQSSNAGTIDLPVSNGIIHILEPEHVFGFNLFSRPLPTPYKGQPFQFPAAIGAKTILEAEDYDFGGQGVAYSDITVANQGNNYRLTEGVDIQAHGASITNSISYPAGFDIGNTAAGEWTLYTVNVPAEGDYKIEIRYGTSNVDDFSRYHIEFNWVKLIGPIIVRRTPGYQNFLIDTQTVHLKAGKQLMRFYWEYPSIQLDLFAITRIN